LLLVVSSAENTFMKKKSIFVLLRGDEFGDEVTAVFL
jgi:hypothetical protein